MLSARLRLAASVRRVSAEPVRFGLLSTARINRAVIQAARGSSRLEVVAVASRVGSRAEAYAREWGIERAHGSYDALLSDDDVEAVYISLPNSLHCEWSIRALEAGKHVLCEKPVGRRAADVDAAFDAAGRAGKVLMEGFMYRHHPQAAKLADLVSAGAIGRLRLIRAAFSFTLRDPGDVRMLPELDGGALMDVGSYCVNGARLLAGEPERVYAEQVTGPTGVDVVLIGTLRFAAGVTAQIAAGLVLPDRGELEAIGEEGSVFLEDPWRCREPVIELRREGGLERIVLEPVDSYRLELESMSAAIRGAAKPLLGRADAVGNTRAIEALYRSAQERAPVEVASPLESCCNDGPAPKTGAA